VRADGGGDLLSVDAQGKYSASLTNASTSNASIWRQNLESKRTIKVSYYLSLLSPQISYFHKQVQEN
jgi:hypothetical protein